MKNNSEKRRSICTLFLIFLLFGVFSACKKSGVRPNQFAETNHWVADQMRTYYYWAEGLPTDRQLNFSQSPDRFFEDLRNPSDRFSWIDKIENLKNQLQGVSKSTGLEFSLYGYTGNKVFGAVIYVIPGSPAARAGLKRGDVFTKINGEQLLISNYNDLLKPYFQGSGFSITLGTLTGTQIEEGGETITIPVARFDEPSVYYKTILETNSGRRVGYLFYNRFLNGKSGELFDAIRYLKDHAVQDIIVDLRYNRGGGISVAGALSALVASQFTFADTFVEYRYNAKLNQYFDQNDPTERFKSFTDVFPGLSKFPTSVTADSVENIIQAIGLQLPRVFVLATGQSASASELIINNLSPYVEVIHIGDTTLGKNEGSITIDPTEEDFNPERLDIEWGIQPIIMKLANGEGFGDYQEGLIPDFRVEDRPPFSPFGSKEDPLIAKALSVIDPAMSTFAEQQTMRRRLFNKLSEVSIMQNQVRPVDITGTLSLPTLSDLQ